MEKQHRINWKKGMEITPEIFIESDNYHIAERQLLGELIASHKYGIFPNSNCIIDYELQDHYISVKISNCTALVSAGDIIHIPDKISFNPSLPIEELSECYAVLSLRPDDKKHAAEPDALHIVSQYEIAFKKTNEPIKNGIPVLKIYKKQSEWNVEPNYIPPTIALNSLPSLMNKYAEIKDIIHKIIGYYDKNDSHYALLMLLQLELNHLSSKESPETLILLMKKLTWIFQEYLKTIKKIEPLQIINNFIHTSYNHYEIKNLLDSGYEGLKEAVALLESKPPEIEEINV
jgi:predicted component of type VI protein secretion system